MPTRVKRGLLGAFIKKHLYFKHFSGKKLSSCLHFLITGAYMKIFSRAALSLLLLSSAIKGQGGEFELENNRQFLVEPGNLVIEHALWDYHHYYPKTCDLKFLDLSINPIFKHWKAIDGDATINTYGAFIQGQLNFGDLWLRVNTIFGDVKQKHTSGDKENSHFGVDDVLLKGGYDFYFNGDDHFGLYLLGGFPTRRHLESKVVLNSEKTEGELEVRTPALGTKNFRVGGGFNGGWTLYDCDDHHLALLLDGQYRYAFPATYTHTVDTANKDGVTETAKHEIRFSPGQTVAAWTALHYAFGNFNVELGSGFTGTFHKKLEFKEAVKEKKDGKGSEGKAEEEKLTLTPNSEASETAPFALEKIRTPDTVKFGATPYVAFSYNSALFDNPATIGFGVGYDFNELHHDKQPRKFQGVIGWINATMSF